MHSRLLNVAAIAMLCHEVNRAYCAAMGDTSQVPWGDAPEWQKESAMAGVQQILDHPETTPEQSHEAWMKLKIEQGWVWGEVKDAVRKQHHCLMPYANLPMEQRVKDYLFGATVRAAAMIVEQTDMPDSLPAEV